MSISENMPELSSHKFHDMLRYIQRSAILQSNHRGDSSEKE